MPETMTVDDLHVQGNLTVGGIAKPSDTSCAARHFVAASGIKRSKCALDADSRYGIPLVSARVWNNLASLLPGTSAADDLGIVGVAGTSSPYITTGDVGSGGTTTRYCRFIFYVPPAFDANYIESSNPPSIIINAGMASTLADGSATLDIQVHRCDKRGIGVDGDVFVGGSKNINSATFAEQKQNLRGYALFPFDMLDMRVTLQVVDSASSNVEARIGAIWLECDIRS